MKVTIYGLLNEQSKEIYVGSTTEPKKRFARHMYELKNNRHHNKKVQEAFNLGTEFSIVILDRTDCNKEDRYKLEDKWIERFRKEGLAYNIAQANFGDVLTHHPDREAIVERIVAKVKARNAKMTKEERKARFGKTGEANGMFGRTHSKEVRERISELNRGRPAHNRGVPASEEVKAKIRAYRAEHRLVGELNPFFGKTHSEETRKLMSAKAMGRKPNNALICTVNGVEYNSFKEASVAIGVPVVTIRHRCNNDNPRFKDWYLGRKCPERIESTSPQRDGSE